MKYLLFFLLVSCSKTYKVGECVQKPDQNSILEVVEVNENGTVLISKINGQIIETREEKSLSDYVSAECPK
jgi:hypothetical protein